MEIVSVNVEIFGIKPMGSSMFFDEIKNNLI